MTLVLANANVIDGVRPGVASGVAVTIENGRIAEIAASGPAGAQVIDLAGAYLLPGLWDVHVHLEWPRIAAATIAEQTVQYAANAAQGLLEAGVTSIRTAGTPHFIDVALKRAYATGRLVGPRIFAGGWFLTTTAGHALGDGVRQDLRWADGLRPGYPRADGRGRGSRQAEPVGRRLRPVVGPALALVPPDRGAGSGLHDLPSARLSGDGARHEPRCREGGGAARRAQCRARLHHGRRVRHAASRARHLVRPHARHHALDAGPVGHVLRVVLAGAARPHTGDHRARGGRGPRASRLVPEGPPLRCQDGARFRPASPPRLGAPRDGAVGERRRDAAAT